MDGERRKQRAPYIGVSLADIIAAGILKPPTRLFRKYKRKTLEAKLAKDGTVDFDGAHHNSFAGVSRADTKADCRRKRRSMTEAELLRLLDGPAAARCSTQ
jgi:hypothetical protein